MSCLLFYTIAPHPNGTQVRQIRQSLRSLRLHDTDCAVHIFHLGQPVPEMAAEASRAKANLYILPSFDEFLRQKTPWVRELANYRVLAKLAFVDSLPAADQILYVDCDTYWFASPAELFAKYADRGFYACPEVGTYAYSHFPRFYGYEERYAELAVSQRANVSPIFNTGVMLLRRGLAKYLAQNTALFLDYVARLQGCGTPLPMPNDNLWIRDEIATAILLGRKLGATWGHFDLADVSLSRYCPIKPRILAHYCTAYEAEFFDAVPWL